MEPKGLNEGNVQTAGDVAQAGIKALTPPERGWILAVVFIIGMIQVQQFYDSQRIVEFLGEHQESQGSLISQLMDVKSEEIRRCQESIQDLAKAVIRDSERAGRVAVETIQQKSKEVPDASP